VKLAGHGRFRLARTSGFGRMRLGAVFELAEHVAHPAVAAMITSISSGVIFSSPLRSLSKRFSVRWQSVTSSVALRKPAPPLMVWKPRKISLSRAVFRVLLEVDQLVVHPGQQVARLDQEILQQVFHP
jgi:hypothetical protein